MRVLIYGLNFFPELTGIGRFSGEMAFYLSENGIQTTVIAAPPYYPQWRVGAGYSGWRYQHETIQGVEVIRCPIWIPKRPSKLNRLPHLLSFALSSLPVVLWQALRWKPDLVLCVIPTLFSAPFALIAARLSGAKVWLHIQDFELDTAFNLGMIPGRDLILPIMQRIESHLLKAYERVSTISLKMGELCVRKGVNKERLFLLPNWVDTKKIYPLTEKNPIRKALGISGGKAVVLYHGNMGAKQGLDTLIDAANILKDDQRIVFLLCGDGAVKRGLVQKAAGAHNIQFLDLVPESQLNQLLNLADIHVLPQLAGAADLVMPSKLGGMLASGKPVIACADEATEIGQIVRSCGRVVPPENPQQLALVINELVADDVQRIALGEAGALYANTNLEREAILSRLRVELNLLAGNSSLTGQ